MRLFKLTFVLFFALALCFIPTKNVFAGFVSPFLTTSDTDGLDSELFAFFDLRDRETFIQVTNTDSDNNLIHIQIFNVEENCNENDFFDLYTGSDTHVYNIRDIVTNDGNPSGVLLPENAYGIIAITQIGDDGLIEFSPSLLIGNLRIINNSGYEYRTNLQGSLGTARPDNLNYTFNFNTKSGVKLSDIVGVTLHLNDGRTEFEAANFTDNQYQIMDIDIVNNNETIFSCRNVIFACIDEDNPRQQELLEFAENANIARFEYGINEAIPHSKGGELLCPGNNILEGTVILTPLPTPIIISSPNANIFSFVGLNNGDGRGSMDTFWFANKQ